MHKKIKKVINHLKYKIKGGQYILGERIDCIHKIAKNTGVCHSTAKKAIVHLYKSGLLSCEDNIYFVIGKPGIRLNTASKQLNLIDRVIVLNNAAILMSTGVYDNEYAAVISNNYNKITMLYIMKNKEYSFNLDIILDIIVNGFVKPDHSKYNDQNSIKEHIRLFTKNMNKLNITITR